MSNARSQRPDRPRKLPSAFYNGITLAGASLAGLALALILFLLILEATTSSHNPYMGIVAFVVLPVFLVTGLAIGLVGIVRQNRKRRQGLPSTEKLPRIDFNNPAHTRATMLIAFGTILFLAMTGFGSFKAYEYTESVQFCGTVCHEVMKPEYTAYGVSPHARVDCVQCHIGSGAKWFVKAKISGAYQVYAVLFNKVHRPIETPIENLRPSRDTCEQCHWPAHFYNEKLVVHDYFGYDEDNTHWKLDLLMKIGGGGEDGPAKGIHWHMNIDNDVQYVATDRQRDDIPWVKSVRSDGTVKIYRDDEADFTDEDLAASTPRHMDCIDCHNRPTHHYNPPSRLVNKALGLGRISPALPGIKSLLVDLMSADYTTSPEALAAIEAGVREEYANVAPELEPEVTKAIATAQQLFSTNIFPEMKVSWRDFPDHIGHLTTPGCFRCHDGHHVTDDGEVLTRDCNTCHTILAQKHKDGSELVSLTSVEYVHPEDIDEEWKVSNCSECHDQ